MTVNEAIVQMIADLTETKSPDHDIAGFVAVMVEIPKGGGKAAITVQFTMHETLFHHKTDMLRDVAAAIIEEVDSLEPKEVH